MKLRYSSVDAGVGVAGSNKDAIHPFGSPSGAKIRGQKNLHLQLESWTREVFPISCPFLVTDEYSS